MLAKYESADLDIMFRRAVQFAEKLSARWKHRAASDKDHISAVHEAVMAKIQMKKKLAEKEQERLTRLSRMHPHHSETLVAAVVDGLATRGATCNLCGSKNAHEYLMLRKRIFVEVHSCHDVPKLKRFFFPAAQRYRPDQEEEDEEDEEEKEEEDEEDEEDEDEDEEDEGEDEERRTKNEERRTTTKRSRKMRRTRAGGAGGGAGGGARGRQQRQQQQRRRGGRTRRRTRWGTRPR